MTTAEDMRVENLRMLIHKTSLADVSRKAKRAPAQLSTMANRKRSFGERVARGIEEDMGLPTGWFDLPHAEDDQTELKPTNGGVSYLSAEAANLFSVPTIVLQGGDQTMNEVEVFLDDQVFKEYFPNRDKKDFCAAIVQDTIMSPELNPMDRVLIDKARAVFTKAGIYCLSTPAGNILRRLTCGLDGKHRVTADNDPNDKQILEDVPTVKIVGRVELIWNIRKA